MSKLSSTKERLTRKIFILAGAALFFSQPTWCDGNSNSPKSMISEALGMAELLEDQKLMYSNDPDELRDCSGIFHRILDGVRNACESLEAPDKTSSRSTRSIAAWYAENDRLVLVHDAQDQDHLIEPGTVMFYGEWGKTYRNRLSQSETLSKIRHMGIVTTVNKDAEGNVQSYTLFHGRRTGKVASTSYHGRHPRNKKHPSLGSSDQQWVATVRLCDVDTDGGADTCSCSP